MMTKGFGTGNCFYLGALASSPGNHKFQCRNMGKLAKSASLQLAFQFSITNSGKTFTWGNHDVADTNFVKSTAKTLSCELKINTYASESTSTVNWYQATWTAAVDGNA